MKNKYFTILAAFLLAFCSSAFAQQNTYRVYDDKMVVEKTVERRDVTETAQAAFARFLDRNGYVNGTYFQGVRHSYADIQSPVLFSCYAGRMMADVHVDIVNTYSSVKITVSCDTVKISSVVSQNNTQYNPARLYPVSMNRDIVGNYLTGDELKQTFDNLIAYMNDVAVRLQKQIINYEQGKIQ